MPRVEEKYARLERQAWRDAFQNAATALVTTTIIPHERNDRPRRECPCCGRTDVHELGRIADLAFLVDRVSGERKNRWQLHDVEAFDDMANEAMPWGTPGVDVWHIPIIYRCAEDQVDVLQDDESEVVLLTGGWRSGKTFLGDAKWSRAWAKRGRRGATFVLLAPALMRTWKNMRKIFFGKENDPPILPTHEGVPLLASGFPEKHTSQHMHFEWIDGSRAELYHAGQGGAGHLEGDDWECVEYDEPARVRHSDAFDVARSRVAQARGQVIMSTVPDDDGWWIYDKIVQPIEQGRAKHSRMVTLSTFDNVFFPLENAKRLEENETDPKVIEEKIHGRWTAKGAFAYADVWDGHHVVDTNSHDPKAWGFKDDCTHAATSWLWKGGVSYIAGADSNWEPQTCALGKIFGDIEHPSTWALCWLAEFTIDGDTEQAARHLAAIEGGRYRGRVGLVTDASMHHNANYHGGHANRSNDAAEYRKLGFKTTAPIVVDGTHKSNPDVLEGRKLVRIMLRADKMLFSEVGCPNLILAMQKVPNRPKRHSDAGTRLDRMIYNFDDVVRYPSWKFFSKRLLPAPPVTTVQTATRR